MSRPPREPETAPNRAEEPPIPSRPRRGARSPRAALAAALLAACSSAGAFLAAPRGERAGSAWAGYRVVLVDARRPEGEVLRALAAKGFADVISESTQPVLVTDWAGLEKTTLGALRGRLVGKDPRRDRYIQALGAWFEARVDGAAYRAYYVPAGPLFSVAALRDALAPFEGGCALPDGGVRGSSRGFDALAAALAALLAALAVLYGAVEGGPTRPRASARLALRAAAALPWLLLAARGMPMAPIAALWAVGIVDASRRLDLPMGEYLRSSSVRAALDSLGRQGFPPAATLASAILSLAIAPEAALSVALALLSSCAFLAALALALASSRPPRRRFVPRPIAAPRFHLGRASPLMAALSVAATLLWIAGAFYAARGGPASPGLASFPRPIAIAGSAQPGPDELRARAPGRGADGALLPDLGDWLEHVALQEALPLERVGESRPDAFAPVSLARPGGEDAARSFDEAWARKAYRGLSPYSVEGMLLAQGFAAAVSAGPGEGRPLAPKDILRYIVLLVPPLGRIAAVAAASRRSTASETRQEA